MESCVCLNCRDSYFPSLVVLVQEPINFCCLSCERDYAMSFVSDKQKISTTHACEGGEI